MLGMTSQEMKSKYSKYIKDNDLMDTFMTCCRLGQEWKRQKQCSDVCFCTNGVNAKRIAWLEKGGVFGKPEKVKIEPHLMNNMCGQNSQFLKEELGWEEVVGYNITACPCSNFTCLEIHSLNRDENGKLRDWTKDFDDQQEKWFIPLLHQHLSQRRISRLFPHCREFMYGKEKCKCNVNWASNLADINDVGNTAEMKNQLREIF